MSLKETLKNLNEPRYKDSDLYVPGNFNPGLFDLNKEKLKKLCPQLFGFGANLRLLAGSYADRWDGIQSILSDGNMNPAIVVSVRPLLVAHYVNLFDAVVLQNYPEELGTVNGWKIGTKLISTQFYDGPNWWKKANKDIDRGPYAGTNYKAVCPVVADLYTDNLERLERKKLEIPKGMWERTKALAEQYLDSHPGMARNGLDVGFKDAIEISQIVFPEFEI